ncbi:hypothetical protein A2966_02500 [Candidatus Roizmanbacteria bacterium RIFCSPLOWO2_01_FULL_41_22]|uniref:Sugar 3,4-ketoisomerase QdtA cupin domain-containing protein n=2 Tax=Candidatus Roizmaniibacteriota TaxID=1752723 RepID=A0A1F7JRV4_9BACT|nr:MAG: hypothetical protein A2966_02500 [Candidatus Roizmanbacteria bacterium RIFCSPLOWO2_01_FULL_41_22]OGK58369.1 MAG: hypothetical protein A3H86_00265 [Candidatus Roizmanbacteria bacterium RIFCSPLOWO2_02_FULL_41_9]
MTIEKKPVSPAYIKDNGLFSLNFSDLQKLASAPIKDISVISIPPQQFGGNHKHPRREMFIGLGEDLELIWVDERGKIKHDWMNKKNELLMFTIFPYVPHVVINHSPTKNGILIEFADDIQHEVAYYNLLEKKKSLF